MRRLLLEFKRFKKKKNRFYSRNGWDQNDWLKEFPSKEDLDKYFPDTPVVLNRIDGHAIIVNSKSFGFSQ
jgi:predicted amidohydrolase YtcJ